MNCVFKKCRVKETHWRQEEGRLDRSIKPHNLPPPRPLPHLRYARKCNASVSFDPFQENVYVYLSSVYEPYVYLLFTGLYRHNRIFIMKPIANFIALHQITMKVSILYTSCQQQPQVIQLQPQQMVNTMAPPPGGIQIVQQVVGADGQIQQIPIQLTSQQLQMIR